MPKHADQAAHGADVRGIIVGDVFEDSRFTSPHRATNDEHGDGETIHPQPQRAFARNDQQPQRRQHHHEDAIHDDARAVEIGKPSTHGPSKLAGKM